MFLIYFTNNYFKRIDNKLLLCIHYRKILYTYCRYLYCRLLKLIILYLYAYVIFINIHNSTNNKKQDTSRLFAIVVCVLGFNLADDICGIPKITPEFRIDTGTEEIGQIVGGYDAIPHSFPWMVGLLFSVLYFACIYYIAIYTYIYIYKSIHNICNSSPTGKD